jgi:AAA15 family ATPase/GTPase
MEEKEVQYITPELPPPPVYFKSLTLENVKCFQGEHFIDLSNGKGGPAQWTVILGNNNTGKTTLLKCLAGVEREITRLMLSEKPIAQFVDLPSPLFEHELNRHNFKIKPGFFSFIGQYYSKKPYFKSLSSWIDPISEWEAERGDYQMIYINSSNIRRVSGLKIFGYGTYRKSEEKKANDILAEYHSNNLIDGIELTNPDIWLIDLFTAGQLGQEKAKSDLELAKHILIGGILPDVLGIDIQSEKIGSLYDNFVVFKTDYGSIRLRDLSYGYQTMIAWILDLVRRMVERYPDSSNPLAEPAIVLVDEIDLHLHPDWQRKIIAHLTKHFPNTQFIVTAHSPLIVQSAEEVNLVILKKENDRVVVDQPKIRSFKGWTVEEIMTDLMQLEGQTMSNTYLDLMAQFDEALDADDYEKAQSAYNQLDAILHPQSSQRKLLKLQMSALSQPNVV